MVLRDVVFEDDGSAGGADAAGHLVIFDGDWETVEWAEIVASHDGFFGGFCLLQCDVVGDEEVGVEVMVEVVDALEEEFDKFDG